MADLINEEDIERAKQLRKEREIQSEIREEIQVSFGENQ